jgi:transposase-like protein
MSKVKPGAPTKYSLKLVQPALDMLCAGATLKTACQKIGVSASTWCNWEHQHPEFLAASARARVAQAAARADEAIELSDEPCLHNEAEAQRQRLRVDTRVRLAGIAAKAAGAKIELSGGLAVKRDPATFSDAELAAIAAAGVARGNALTDDA